MDYNKFNREQDMLLIEQMKSKPALYDASDVYHKNYVIKHRMWETISEKMEIPIPDLKRRWKNLRDHYNKKKKTEKYSTTTNNWELMPHLSFLSNVVTNRYCPSNVEYSNNENQRSSDYQTTSFQLINEEDESVIEDVIAEELHKEKRKTTEVTDENFAKKSRSEISVIESKRTPLHKFFDSMADAVAQFPVHLAAEAKLKVCQVINELEIRMHKEAIEYQLSKENINKNSRRSKSMSPSSSSFVSFTHANTTTDSDSELSNTVEVKTEQDSDIDSN